MDRYEAMHIRRVLLIVEWRRGAAAELLGISRKNLWEKIRKHSIAEPVAH